MIESAVTTNFNSLRGSPLGLAQQRGRALVTAGLLRASPLHLPLSSEARFIH
jgi:hypothetical protein